MFLEKLNFGTPIVMSQAIKEILIIYLFTFFFFKSYKKINSLDLQFKFFFSFNQQSQRCIEKDNKINRTITFTTYVLVLRVFSEFQRHTNCSGCQIKVKSIDFSRHRIDVEHDGVVVIRPIHAITDADVSKLIGQFVVM